ncbi:MAG: PQQ-binding-like beta-propeller repeat protein [Candidatus Hydrogenedentes bacterium]|nr:PQQ-binding-like beta-propeller repeat protein [Candidatus Hydrogenedentota bacterium]
MKGYVLSLLLMGCLALSSFGEGSPQFRGPQRDGRFEETGLLKAWPDEGPPKLWVTTGLGNGYSSPSIVDGKLYVPGMVDDENSAIFVLNEDGVIERTIPTGPETEDTQAPGPRSTPTIDGDYLYMLSGLGELFCLHIPSGEKRWSVNILERFQGPNIMYTLAESLLIDGERLICTPGGTDAAVAALDKHTGETLWSTKGFSDEASYCAPVIYTHNGRRLLFTETANFLACMDAEDGRLLWKIEHLTRDGIHAVSPMYLDGLLFYTGGYESENGAIRLSEDGSSYEKVWQTDALDCQHHGLVLDQGYLYGTSHMQGNRLVCLDMKSGEVMWTAPEVRQGVVIYADGMLYIYEGSSRAFVHLVKADSKAFQHGGKFRVTDGDGRHWAHPAIVKGVLYIRHGDALIAYDVKDHS